MKKALLSLLLFFPLFIVAQSVTFHDSWVEYDVIQNGKTGMLFHYKFSIKNYLNQNMKAVMFIGNSQNDFIPTHDPEFSSTQGSICTSANFVPIYNDALFEDFKLFISYQAMPDVSEVETYKYFLDIRTAKDDKIIQRSSPWWNLDWASHDIAIKVKGKITSTITISNQNNSKIIINNHKVDVNINDNEWDNDPLPYNYNKPTIDWLSANTSSTASFLAKAGIKSNSTLTQTSLSVNGTIYRGMKTVVNDGYQMVISETVTLHNGVNEITVSATNASGTTTQTFNVTYNGTNPQPYSNEKRIALVIGNASYPSQSLNNPINDANDVSASLKKRGFDVTTLTDCSKRQMEDAIALLRAKADKNSVALFYYAGHGIQKDGHNYLIPVDAVLRDASDVEYACTDVGRVLSNLEASGSNMNIIVLDACRDNPFERSWTRGTGTRGLTGIDTPDGTIIAYATAAGTVAQDGQRRNSPYTEAFLQELNTPGIEILDLFRNVNALVKQSTNNAQKPWFSTNSVGKFYF